jgi:phosphatidylserine/phosphatidylglycerophosphate/cardiolipin synthase-like enzyme
MHFENVILINNENFAKQIMENFEQDKANSYLVDETF